jgi:hypothetical protein
MTTLVEQLRNILQRNQNRIQHLESDKFRVLEKTDAGERDCTMELVKLLREQSEDLERAIQFAAALTPRA